MDRIETSSESVESESDAYELIEAGESVSSEMETRGGEHSLNNKEIFLANRIRQLQHENDELKRSVQENGEALQLCTTEISSWNENQRKIHNSWCEKYEQAREIVCELRNDNIQLKSQLEELNSRYAKSESVTGGQENADRANTDVANLMETHVKQFICLSDEQRKAEEASFFGELFKICSQSNNSTKNEEAIIALKDALDHLNVTCDEQKASLEQQKSELEEARKQKGELEMQLLDATKKGEKDMEKDVPCQRDYEDKIRAYEDKIRDYENKIRDYEDKIRNLNAAKRKEKDLSEKREIKNLNEREELLKKISELENQLCEKNREAEFARTRATLQIKEDQNSRGTVDEVNERNKEVENLKSQVCSFYQELQEKEAESDKWREQEQIYKQKVTDLNLLNSKLKDDLNLIQKSLIQTREEFAIISVEYENLQLLCNAKDEEIKKLRTKCDNLTAQVISSEDILEEKQQEFQTLQQSYDDLQEKYSTFEIMKHQIDIYRADFEIERQARVEAQDQYKRLRDENNRLRVEPSDPSGSGLAELQRLHGNRDSNAWNNDQYLAPRGQPSHHGLQQQVSGGSCSKCERVFDNLDSLQTHVVQCAASQCDTEERKCPICQEFFPDLDTLQIHTMDCLGD